MAVTAINIDTANRDKVICLFPENEENENKTTTTVNNKKKGKKSEVYTYTIEDLKRVSDYFKDRNDWLQYLLFTISCNMVRRINDTLCLTWENFYNPATGELRENLLEIEEMKTDKFANPKINSACRSAIELYIEKTGCNPAENNYSNPVFLQLTGTHKGKILTDSGHLKSLKKAAARLNINYNIGTHSARKTFGKISRMIHPNDYDSMEILQSIYNHSSTKVTKRYIGLTREKVNQYYDDMGEFFGDYISGCRQFVKEDSITVTLDYNDLSDIIKIAYETGKNNATSTDSMVHIDAITELFEMVRELSK